MKKRFILVSSFMILYTSQVQASSTVYENAEDKRSTRWSIIDNDPSRAKILNVIVSDKEDRVIQLKGAGGKNAYMIGANRGSSAWNNTKEKYIRWSMKSNNHFSVYIGLKTKKGHRYLHYTATDIDYGINRSNEQNIHHGLGSDANNDTWKTFNRNLADDLKDFESDNSIISINSLIVRGSAFIDDIILSSTDDGSTDDGSIDDGSIDDGSIDDGSIDDGSTDDGSTDDGSIDDGSIDDGSINIPKCNQSNPEVQIINKLSDWNTINNKNKSIFCVKPNIYLPKAHQDNILITASGTPSKKRYILLNNGNNIHPGKLVHKNLAKVRFTFKGAKHWVVDRMSFWGVSKEYTLQFKNSDYITINRFLLEDTNYGVVLYSGTDHTTIQNSRFERNSYRILSDLPAISLNDEGRSNISIKNTKILNNEIYNYNDPFQSVKYSQANQKNVNYEGTLIEDNHFYIDSKLYTDCAGHYNENGNCAYAENAIDLKSGSSNANNPMIIRNNKMWGFKKADKTNSPFRDSGTAIGVHFGVKNVKINNNLIFNSDQAITASNLTKENGMEDAEISNNIIYNIKQRAFYIGQVKNLTMSNNLFKNTSSNEKEYWGILDRITNLKFNNNIVSSTPQNYHLLRIAISRKIQQEYIGNKLYGEDAYKSGFEELSNDPTSNYKDLVFTTDNYTNNPRTIRIPKVLKP